MRNTYLIGGSKHDMWQEKGQYWPDGGASTYLEVYFTFENVFWGKGTFFEVCFTYLEAYFTFLSLGVEDALLDAFLQI
jgi:hypothetical protein